MIIKLSRPVGRDIYNKPFETVQRDFDLEVYELAPSTKLGSFPGYNNVLLTHKDLQTIVKMEAPEWKTALSSVKYVLSAIKNAGLKFDAANIIVL